VREWPNLSNLKAGPRILADFTSSWSTVKELGETKSIFSGSGTSFLSLSFMMILRSVVSEVGYCSPIEANTFSC
jgi:hypothetical protein